ncbi:toprim domain-containing protein [Parvularcula sp. LCG005]|uniref:DUF7146 domain-containing protein n=1 Tax=Parvularcula sp. LCG005 TaxID=3078805 RepID=UPI002943D562|nr:toprim domain-containing protein [Parvularcula sp. LCG005]WOI54320.1 toprim domain-containing protein [Parvularcula sp. LCG005]
MMERRQDTTEIREGLRQRAGELAERLYPGGRRDGVHYWPPTTSGTKLARGDRDSSICIDVAGATAGRWVDFGDRAAKGDLINLIAFAEFGCYPPDGAKEAFAWARQWLGLSDPERAAQYRKAAAARPAPAPAQTDDREVKARKAYGWWLNRGQPLPGTHGEDYLRGRGIRLDWLRRPPEAVRFSPALKAPDGQFYPGLLTAMSGPDGRIRAVHRTFLHPHEPRKATLPKAKMMWGDVQGTSIRLAKGDSSYSPEKAYAAGHREGRQVITEGIEDALSWAMFNRDDRVTAAGSISNLANAPLFACCDHYLVVADNDPQDSTSRADLERALDTLADRAGAKTVSVTRPLAQKDVNELLQDKVNG